MGRSRAGGFNEPPGAPPNDPADSGGLPLRNTDAGNGITPRRALGGGRYAEQGVTRMAPGVRIASEANALGKAEGYADGGTVLGR